VGRDKTAVKNKGAVMTSIDVIQAKFIEMKAMALGENPLNSGFALRAERLKMRQVKLRAITGNVKAAESKMSKTVLSSPSKWGLKYQITKSPGETEPARNTTENIISLPEIFFRASDMFFASNMVYP
jgi:hypothetical protein